MFRNGEVKKTYWAITRNCPPKQADTLTHYITSTERNNKSYASDTEKKGSQRAVLMYRYTASCADHIYTIKAFTRFYEL